MKNELFKIHFKCFLNTYILYSVYTRYREIGVTEKSGEKKDGLLGRGQKRLQRRLPLRDYPEFHL